MKNLTLLCFVYAALGALALPAGAEPYWYTYEGNDLPENEGWERFWGNENGAYEGDGAIRTIENGILTMDSMYSPFVYDYACHYMYGTLDPDPGELFVAEWRVYVEQWEASDDHWDSKVSICADDGGLLGLGLFPDHVVSQFENDVDIPITPGEYHEYSLQSWDMNSYELYIDGELAHIGILWGNGVQSKFSFGDCVQGAASLAHWDYVRYGVVPEPNYLAFAVYLYTWTIRRNIL